MAIDFTTTDDGATRIISMTSVNGLNILSRSDLIRLAEHLSAADADDSVRVIVLTGTERAFSVGADLTEFPEPPCDPTEWVKQTLFDISMPERLRKPVLAVVEGQALAGGFELALACDWIFTAADTRFAMPEARFGMVAGFAAARLAASIGHARARWILITGAFFSARDALLLGLHMTVTDPGKELVTAKIMANEIHLCSPHAVRLIKQRSVASASRADANFDWSLATYGQLWNTPDTIESLRAFRERRAPVFRKMDDEW